MHRKAASHVMLALALVALVSLALVPSASADQVYHSQHIELMPTGNAPLRSGFVENIHVNGPNIFALERYVLNGAAPNEQYTVTLLLADAACTSVFAAVPTATFSTNRAGNGTSMAVVRLDDVPDFLHDGTFGVRWDITSDSGEGYSTACTLVATD